MDRFVVSSLSGHVKPGSLPGELIQCKTDSTCYQPLQSIIDWRRHLSIFTPLPNHVAFVTFDCKTFASVVHYMETKRHEFIAIEENRPRNVSLHSHGLLVGIHEKAPKNVLRQSCRLLPASYLIDKWVTKRDEHLENALMLLYSQNHYLREILLATNQAELWVGNEFEHETEQGEKELFDLFFTVPKLAGRKTEVQHFRRFYLLEKVRYFFRCLVFPTPSFQEEVLTHPSFFTSKRSCSEQRLSPRDLNAAVLEKFVYEHSFTELVININACYFQLKFELATQLTQLAARRFTLNKHSFAEIKQELDLKCNGAFTPVEEHHYSREKNKYGFEVSMNRLVPFFIKDNMLQMIGESGGGGNSKTSVLSSTTHPLDVQDACEMYHYLLSSHPQLCLPMVYQLIHETYGRFSVFTSAEEVQSALWTLFGEKEEEVGAESIKSRYGYLVNRWQFSPSMTKLSVWKKQGVERKAFFPPQFNEEIDGWQLSNITDIRGLFEGTKVFNRSLASWDTRKIQYMDYLFFQAKAFNQPLTTWSTESVKSMKGMFMEAISFNQSLEAWNHQVEHVQSTAYMFKKAVLYNQSMKSFGWYNLREANNMFEEALSFNGHVDDWEVGSIRSMHSMFRQAVLFNRPLTNWSFTSVVDSTMMFQGCRAFQQELNHFPWHEVPHYEHMLKDADSFAWEDNPWKSGILHLHGGPHYLVGDDHPLVPIYMRFSDHFQVLKIAFSEEEEAKEENVDDEDPVSSSTVSSMKWYPPEMDHPQQADVWMETHFRCAFCWNILAGAVKMSCGCNFCFYCVVSFGFFKQAQQALSCPCCRFEPFETDEANVDLMLHQMMTACWQYRLSKSGDGLLKEKKKYLHWKYKSKLSMELLKLYRSIRTIFSSTLKEITSENPLFENTRFLTEKMCFHSTRQAFIQKRHVKTGLRLPTEVSSLKRCLSGPFSCYPCIRILYDDTCTFEETHPGWQDVVFMLQTIGRLCIVWALKEKLHVFEFQAWLSQKTIEWRTPCIPGVRKVIQYLTQKSLYSGKPLFLSWVFTLLSENGSVLEREEKEAKNNHARWRQSSSSGGPVSCMDCRICEQVVAEPYWMQCCGSTVCLECVCKKYDDQCNLVQQEESTGVFFACPSCGFDKARLCEPFIRKHRQVDDIASVLGRTEMEYSDRCLQGRKLRASVQKCQDLFVDSCEPSSIVYVLKMLYEHKYTDEQKVRFSKGVDVDGLYDLFTKL